ncbi:MAG: hypothetical protein JST00_28165 [Deltaproteobacteria bacterium]|nr:hypothetical protein [Deltaproteobacteria bacterium]
MLGYILALAMPFVLVPIVGANKERTHRRMLAALFAAYFLRILLQSFFREVSFFSYGAGGDWIHYEEKALVVQQFWEHGVYRYITSDDWDYMGQTSLPPNLFGVIYFLNRGPTRIGCCSFVALAACLTCLNLYYLALDLGVDGKKAFTVFLVMLFSPAFLLYTSDLYKDGLVLLFVVGAFASAIRLSRGFSLVHLAIGIASCVCLYGCRFYLIFVTMAPLLIGALGVGSKNAARQLVIALLIVAGLIYVLAFTQVFRAANDTANLAWDAGTTGATSLTEHANRTGSNVDFDDAGSPTGALGLKLIYTLFAPFPWMGGSLALQIGKVEALIWYYMFYRACVAGRRLWRENRGLLLMFLSFLVPTTVMYALIMVNVGLTLRERMGIVFIGYMLAMLSWVKDTEATTAPAMGEEPPSRAVRHPIPKRVLSPPVHERSGEPA